MFRLIGLADEAGTGIPKIIASWRELGFRLPAIDVGTERYEFSLDLRHAHLISEDDRTWLRSLAEDWPEAEQLALVLARHDGEVDNRALRRLTGQHPADVTKVLGGLRDRGLLRMLGSGRGARYELGNTALRTEAARTTEIVGNSTNNDGSSTNSDPSSTNMRGDSTNSHDLREHAVEGPGDATALWPRLEEIAKPAREQSRLEPAARDTIVVRLCAITPLTLSQLALLLQRSKNTVRLSLGPLLADGRLARYYPDPNHPRQKYTIAEQIVAQVNKKDR